jgi:hypothetical protein
MSEKMRGCISSPPDRERLVAEIFLGDGQWAELNQDGNKLDLEICPERSGEYWSLDFEGVVDILVEAKRRLVGA